MGLSFDLLGFHVKSHLAIFRFRCAYSKNFCNLVICGWMWWMLLVMMTRSLKLDAVLHVVVDMLK